MRYSRRLELFEKLKNEYEGFLTSTLWKLTGDADVFAEAFQYALLAVWMNLEKLTSPKAGAYIYRIALSANSKAWRNRTRPGAALRRSRVGKNGQIPIVRPPPNDPVDEETLHIVRKEIAKLPARQSEAIVMRCINQCDYQTIADKLKCTEDTARSHVSKAINTLWNNLADLQE